MSIFTRAFDKLRGYDEPPAGTITVRQPVWGVAGPLHQAAWQTAR
jgi:hypothetical protein